MARVGGCRGGGRRTARGRRGTRSACGVWRRARSAGWPAAPYFILRDFTLGAAAREEKEEQHGRGYAQNPQSDVADGARLFRYSVGEFHEALLT